MQIVIMARDAVSAALEFAANLVPAVKPVQNDHLVPVGPFRIDDGDVWHRQVESGCIVINIGRIVLTELGSSADFTPDSILTDWST